MASAKLYSKDGQEKASLELNDAIFGVAPNMPLVHQVTMALLSNKRQGNHETKTRGEVSGGGIKPYRQKGTGRARHGSTREPQMKGGGTVWGPHKRSYRKQAPLKMRRKALCCVLSDRARNNALAVLEDFTLDKPKTKPIAELYATLVPEGRKTLLVTPKYDANILVSARNVPRLTVRTACDLNALDVLDARRVILMQGALTTLEERLT